MKIEINDYQKEKKKFRVQLCNKKNRFEIDKLVIEIFFLFSSAFFFIFLLNICITFYESDSEINKMYLELMNTVSSTKFITWIIHPVVLNKRLSCKKKKTLIYLEII